MSVSNSMLPRLRAKNQSLAHAVHEVLLFTLLNCYVGP